MEQEKVLLNVEETAAYLNLGMTKTRECHHGSRSRSFRRYNGHQ